MGNAQACHEAVREALQELGGVRSTGEISAWIQSRYPKRWQPATVTAHLYGCSVNNAKAYRHHAHMPKFLYAHGNGRYELYSAEKHGQYEAGIPEGEVVDTAEESSEDAMEISLTLERDLETFLVQNLSQLEPGLKLADVNGKPGRQLDTPAGIIDLLCHDAEANLVVIELKAGLARDSALGQICGYLGWARTTFPTDKKVRGILIAQDFTDRVKYGADSVAVKLLRYKMNFTFEHASVSPEGSP